MKTVSPRTATAQPAKSKASASAAMIFCSSTQTPLTFRKTYAAPAPPAAVSSPGAPATATSPSIATATPTWSAKSAVAGSSFYSLPQATPSNS